MFEYSSSDCEKSSSLGFIELLNMQDFGPSIFDLLQNYSGHGAPFINSDDQTSKLNAPATPNYSSISSESSHEHPNKEDEDDDDDKEVEAEAEAEEEIHKTKKELVYIYIYILS